MSDASRDVSFILERLRSGDDGARDRLFSVVYEELRTLARAKMAKEPAGGTLQATALVNEAYLRLVDGSEVDAHWENLRHFFGAAAEAMRRILIDRARRRETVKHGGGRKRVPLAEDLVASEEPSLELLAVNEALERLEAVDSKAAEVVKYRYFLGLTVPETAECLGIARRTVHAKWSAARAWIRTALSDGTSSE